MRSRRSATWPRFARVLVISMVAVAGIVVTASPASAGGSWLSPVRDRYEPGDTATLVAYVTGGGSLGSVEDGPFFAYLRRLEAPLQVPNELQMAPFTPQASDLPLGELDLTPQGRTDYAAYRVSIEFAIPRGLPIGRYGVIYCTATCTKGLSDLIGGVIFVGINPDAPLSRTWPLTEPEIANLPGDSMLYGPGWAITARDARTGLPPGPVDASSPTRPISDANTERSAAVQRRAVPGDAAVGSGTPTWLPPALAVSVVLCAGALALGVAHARLRRARSAPPSRSAT